MSGRELLRAELEHKGIRAAEAARQIGVSKATVSEWLSGAKRPVASRAREIEIWSQGRIAATSWWTEEERARVSSREADTAEIDEPQGDTDAAPDTQPSPSAAE